MKTFKKQLFAICILVICLGCKHDDIVTMANKLKERIPIGMSAFQVEKVLSDQKTEYSFVTNENAFYAIIRPNDKTTSSLTKSITFIIKLDVNKQVSETQLKEVYTGP